MKIEVGVTKERNRALRIGFVLIGIIMGGLYAIGLYHTTVQLGFAFGFFFLGMTDFGRRCPLLLSIQHHINRHKARKREQLF